MKVTLEIIDSQNGSVSVSVAFDPPMDDSVSPTSAQKHGVAIINLLPEISRMVEMEKSKAVCKCEVCVSNRESQN